MNDVKNVLLVGVGGQGTILASKILTKGLISAGYDVKMSEVHGMSQRGGSVTTQVRYGKKVHSPIIGSGQGDVLVAFEKMEALRLSNELKVGGIVVVNNYKMISAPILAGKADYPSGILDELKNKFNTTVIDAYKLSKDLGNAKAMNVVLLGALIKALKLENLDWDSILKSEIKPQFYELNKKALSLGMQQVK